MARRKKAPPVILINEKLLAELEAAPTVRGGKFEWTEEQDQVLINFFTKLRYEDLKAIWEKYYDVPFPSSPTLRKRYYRLTGIRRKPGEQILDPKNRKK